MNRHRSLPAVLLFAVAGFSVAEGEVESSAATPASSGGRISLEWMVQEDFNDDIRAEFGSVAAYEGFITLVDSRFNIDLEYEFVPSQEYTEKQNLREAAGNPPDIAHVSSGDFLRLARMEMFEPLATYIRRDKHWSQIPSEEFLLFYSDGEVYAVPNSQGTVSVAFYNRALLDQLGMNPPRDADGLYDAMRAVGTQLGPRIAGAISVDETLYTLEPWFHLFTFSNPTDCLFYDDGDGNIQNALVDDLDGIQDALRFLNRAYRDGLLITVDSIFSHGIELFASGQTGFLGYWNTATQFIAQRGVDETSGLSIVTLPPLDTGGDWRSYRRIADYAGDAVSASSPNAERAVELLFYAHSGEGVSDRFLGPEGTTWTGEGGSFQWLDLEAAEAFQASRLAFALIPIDLPFQMPWLEEVQRVSDVPVAQSTTLVTQRSPTYAGNRSSFLRALRAALYNVITGEARVEAFPSVARGLVRQYEVEQILQEVADSW